jgi:hypothetical protein
MLELWLELVPVDYQEWPVAQEQLVEATHMELLE